MISFWQRVSDCEELEAEKLEGVEEGDIVKIWMACSVLEMAGAYKTGSV